MSYYIQRSAERSINTRNVCFELWLSCMFRFLKKNFRKKTTWSFLIAGYMYAIHAAGFSMSIIITHEILECYIQTSPLYISTFRIFIYIMIDFASEFANSFLKGDLIHFVIFITWQRVLNIINVLIFELRVIFTFLILCKKIRYLM